ncbi:DUF2281 domain-containing protein [Dyadobacter sp. CY107]|uniref:DUF2281 domain-containing protein n=1 Tax=Dyadobacter fanqingshengii TaxID=2906443 RepID=UPI001F24113A|nr:DUF2281 domain-containing protein [Dyadobacter fanqingshengii]MCF2503115.1 DUF2281 domain-containing protein [Dyadobacter fanqingshengii]
MLTAVKGIFENGQITLTEKPPVNKRMEVIVTFIDETPKPAKKRKAGVVAGKFKMADDFDEPLDDLKEYM